MGDFVSEFPLPPKYYKLFGDSNVVIQPPPLVPGVDLNQLAFGGSFQRDGTESCATNNSTDYKAELHRNYKAILNTILETMANVSSVDSHDEKFAAINETIATVQNLFSQYRYHMAREELNATLSSDLKRVLEIEDNLKRAVESAEKEIGVS